MIPLDNFVKRRLLTTKYNNSLPDEIFPSLQTCFKKQLERKHYEEFSNELCTVIEGVGLIANGPSVLDHSEESNISISVQTRLC